MNDSLSSVSEQLKNLSAFDRLVLLTRLEKLVEEDKSRSLQLKEELENPKAFKGKCPHCGSSDSKRNGKYKKYDLQRYLCKGCGKTYTAMTGTVISHVQKKSDFMAYGNTVRLGLSLREAAEKHGVCLETAHSWRHKYNHALKSAGKDDYLHGNIATDEFYEPYSQKGAPDLASPRGRGSDRSERGIGNSQVCILVSVGDRGGESLEVAGLSRLTATSVDRILSPLVRKQRKGGKRFLCSDKSNAFPQFAKAKGLKTETIKAGESHTTESGAHFQVVNNIHMRFRKWMRKFNGVASKYLEGYLHLFRVRNKIKNSNEPFKSFWGLAISARNSFIPYKAKIKLFKVQQQICLS